MGLPIVSSASNSRGRMPGWAGYGLHFAVTKLFGGLADEPAVVTGARNASRALYGSKQALRCRLTRPLSGVSSSLVTEVGRRWLQTLLCDKKAYPGGLEQCCRTTIACLSRAANSGPSAVKTWKRVHRLETESPLFFRSPRGTLTPTSSSRSWEL